MTNLHSLLLENSNTNALLLTKVRDIVNRLEFAGWQEEGEAEQKKAASTKHRRRAKKQ